MRLRRVAFSRATASAQGGGESKGIWLALAEIGHRRVVACTVQAQLIHGGDDRDELVRTTRRPHSVRRRLNRMVKFLKAISSANSNSGDLVTLKLDRQNPIPRAELQRR